MFKPVSLGLIAALMGFTAPGFAADPPPNWTKPAQTQAQPATAVPQARIAFARRGGINNWMVTDERSIYVQDLHRQWYKATLMSTCIGLQFAQRVGFTFEPNGDLDKFSAIRYDRQTCPFTSFVMVDPPARQKGRVGTPGAMPAMPPASAAASGGQAIAKAPE